MVNRCDKYYKTFTQKSHTQHQKICENADKIKLLIDKALEDKINYIPIIKEKLI